MKKTCVNCKYELTNANRIPCVICCNASKCFDNKFKPKTKSEGE